jgi:hypothetical protein
MDPSAYCRDVESYLCRKNDGHLIRIVGPAFDLVRGWAERQIPLSVVHRAIDQTFERYYSKGLRRRPVRIEYCEADALDLFDEWRRAVGVGGAVSSDDADERTPPRRGLSLAKHVERVIVMLTAARARDGLPVPLAEAVARLVDELAAMKGDAKAARGEPRQRLLVRLREIDDALTAVARDAADEQLHATLRADAERDLEAFRGRMPPQQFDRAIRAGTDRLLREHFRLPRIAFE